MWLSRLYERFRDLVHELGKFGVVGGVAYVIDTALLLLLRESMHHLTAKTIAAIIATTVAFVGNRFWTWRDRARSGLAREYVLYFTFNGIGLAISLVFLWFSHDVLGAAWPAFKTGLADVISANVIGLAAASAFRFWSYRRWVFPHPEPTPELASAQPGSIA